MTASPIILLILRHGKTDENIFPKTGQKVPVMVDAYGGDCGYAAAPSEPRTLRAVRWGRR
jgi:hypothetical protein